MINGNDLLFLFLSSECDWHCPCAPQGSRQRNRCLLVPFTCSFSVSDLTRQRHFQRHWVGSYEPHLPRNVLCRKTRRCHQGSSIWQRRERLLRWNAFAIGNEKQRMIVWWNPINYLLCCRRIHFNCGRVWCSRWSYRGCHCWIIVQNVAAVTDFGVNASFVFWMNLFFHNGSN